MLADWRDLEVDEIPEWSSKAQGVVLGILSLVFLLISTFFLLLPINAQIDRVTQQETALRNQFRYKAEQVASLPDVDEQMNALTAFYERLKMQLPEKSELAILLAGINDTGLQYDLNFKRLDWQKGKQIGWLYKVPLKIELEGSYNNIGLFSSAISRLPRIVALQDFTLRRIDEQNDLALSVEAYTYRFVEKRGSKK